MGKLTKAQRAMIWLMNYRDGNQNGKPYAVNSVWSRGNGGGQRGLREARELGLIQSRPDATINLLGWRHDITPAGRAALSQREGE